MTSGKFPVRFLPPLLLVFALYAQGQGNINSNLLEKFKLNTDKLKSATLVPPAYQQEALRLIIEEANHVAQELHLSEALPITETNLLEKFIPSPQMARRLQAIGNVTTSNYTYYFSIGSKFSFLTKRNLGQDYNQLQKEYLWPMSLMNTNTAYQMATQILALASMDVNALNRDCRVQIDAFTPEGKNGEHFVPVYWVYWMAKETSARGAVASIELFEPTKTIRQLHVNKSEYILRKPLEITNLDFLLLQTNAPTGPWKHLPPKIKS